MQGSDTTVLRNAQKLIGQIRHHQIAGEHHQRLLGNHLRGQKSIVLHCKILLYFIATQIPICLTGLYFCVGTDILGGPKDFSTSMGEKS